MVLALGFGFNKPFNYFDLPTDQRPSQKFLLFHNLHNILCFTITACKRYSRPRYRQLSIFLWFYHIQLQSSPSLTFHSQRITFSFGFKRFSKVVITLDFVVNFKVTKHQNQVDVVFENHLPPLRNSFGCGSHGSNYGSLIQTSIDVTCIYVVSMAVFLL